MTTNQKPCGASVTARCFNGSTGCPTHPARGASVQAVSRAAYYDRALRIALSQTTYYERHGVSNRDLALSVLHAEAWDEDADRTAAAMPPCSGTAAQGAPFPVCTTTGAERHAWHGGDCPRGAALREYWARRPQVSL